MSDKPRRAWFQIHLSTAIVLMFVAGIILGLNFNIQLVRWKDQVFYQRGWPVPFYTENLVFVLIEVTINLMAWLAILGVTAFVCELSGNRRRERLEAFEKMNSQGTEWERNCRQVDELHARLRNSQVSTDEINRIVLGFKSSLKTNCASHATAMLYAVLPIISCRPDMRKTLLYYPVAALVAGGHVEAQEIISFISWYVSSNDNYLPLKCGMNDWFAANRETLETTISEILDEHWPIGEADGHCRREARAP